MKYIKGFDGLRAISILFVLFTHLGLYYQVEEYEFLKNNFNLYSGGTGVVIFFSISGFLISSLLLEEKTRNGRINFKFFFIRRFLRLLPPLVVFFIIMMILMTTGYLPKEYLALFVAFIYLYNYVPVDWYVTELGHTWSLGVEEQFYIFWPFVISAFRKTPRLLFLAFGILILSIAWKVIYQNNTIVELKAGVPLREYFFLERWFIPACLPIMIGSLSAIILHKYRSRLENIFHANYWFILFSFFLYTAQIYFPGISFNLTDILIPIGVSLFLIWIIFNQKSVLVNILEFKPVAFIGKISYGLYVYQGLFLRTGPGGNLEIQQFPLNISLVFLTAVFSYFFVEKKLIRYKKKFTSVITST